LSLRFQWIDYIEVLKPKETSLLLFIGLCSFLISAKVNTGFSAGDFLMVILAILLGSAGANGLTNYLDREVDSRMKRTCKRPLPDKRINPPEKALPLIILLITGGLISAYILSPVCFFIGLAGIIASSIFRKTFSCTILGIIAGSSPVLVGWYAVTKHPNIEILPVFLFLMIALWTPIHVWTLMIANRSDYENAGLRYFPLNYKDSEVIKILVILSFILAAITLSLYFCMRQFHWLYLIISIILNIILVIASIRLWLNPVNKNAWIIYKLSAFPYLGIIFAVMTIDIWIL